MAPDQPLSFSPTGMTRRFTLLEVLVAAAILAVAVALIISLLAAARDRLLRAERKWAQQHLLAQGAEYFLLAGPQAQPPDWLLTDGYAARCELRKAEPAAAADKTAEPVSGWTLGTYHIQLLDRGGQVLDEIDIKKLTREEDP